MIYLWIIYRSKATTFYGPLEFDHLNMNNAEAAFVQAFGDPLQTFIVSPKDIAEVDLAYPISCISQYGVRFSFPRFLARLNECDVAYRRVVVNALFQAALIAPRKIISSITMSVTAGRT